MTLLVRAEPAAAPLPLSQALDGELRFSVAKLDPPLGASTRFGEGGIPQHEISPADAPTPELRSALRDRLARIAVWMRPAGHEFALEEYRMLAANLEAKDADDDTVMREQLGFVEATATLPTFALRDACAAFRHGKVGGGRWMPKGGEVRREAEGRLQTLARERRLIETVLAAKVRPAPNLQRSATLAAAARELADSMKADNGSPKRGSMTDSEIREAHALSEAIRTGTPDPRPLPKLTAEHRRALGLPRPASLEPAHVDSRSADDDAA